MTPAPSLPDGLEQASFITIRGGVTSTTSWPAATATWGEQYSRRFVRIVPDGTITGEEASQLATVYALVNGQWGDYDWGQYDLEKCDTEDLPYTAEKIKVVFTNGLEWVITNEPIEQGIESMDFELPIENVDAEGCTITLKAPSTIEDVAEHLKGSAELDGGEIALIYVRLDSSGKYVLSDGDSDFNEIFLQEDGVTISISTKDESCTYQEFTWA